MEKIKKEKNAVVCLVIVFFLSLLYQMIFNAEGKNYFDAYAYRELAMTFWWGEKFSLQGFNGGIRGVWFPMILSFFTKENVIWGWRVFAAGMTVYYVYFFPTILTDNCRSKEKIIALFVLIYTFWNGLFLYFLSDAVALMFLSIGLSFILKDKNVYYFIGGILLYIAYNTRTIYLFPIIFILCYLLFYKLIKKERTVIMSLFIVLLGISVATIPQVIVNKNNYDVISAKVITAGDYGNGLFTWQLAEGLKLAEFETYVGDHEKYSDGGVRFKDYTGERIWHEEHIDSQTITITEMVRLVLKYPLEIIGIYVRHFVNMLNPVWGEVYIKDLEKTKMHLMTINYIILYVFAYWNIVVKEKKINNIKKLLDDDKRDILKKYIARGALLIPCITILPGCVELRFFYPMYMLIYVYVIYDIGIKGMKQILESCKKNYISVGLSFIVGFCVLCAVVGNTYSNLDGNLWIGLM